MLPQSGRVIHRGHGSSSPSLLVQVAPSSELVLTLHMQIKGSHSCPMCDANITTKGVFSLVGSIEFKAQEPVEK